VDSSARARHALFAAGKGAQTSELTQDQER